MGILQSAEVLGQDVGMVLKRDTELDAAWWGGKDGAAKAGLSVRHRAGAGQALELWEAVGRELCEHLVCSEGGEENSLHVYIFLKICSNFRPS